MASYMRLEKVSALPVTLTPNTIYLVKNPDDVHQTIYVSSLDGTVAYKTSDAAQITAVAEAIIKNVISGPYDGSIPDLNLNTLLTTNVKSSVIAAINSLKSEFNASAALLATAVQTGGSAVVADLTVGNAVIDVSQVTLTRNYTLPNRSGQIALVDDIFTVGDVPLTNVNPEALGTASPGVAEEAARQDHVHPTTGLLLEADLNATDGVTQLKVGQIVQSTQSPGDGWLELNGGLVRKTDYPDLDTALNPDTEPTFKYYSSGFNDQQDYPWYDGSPTPLSGSITGWVYGNGMYVYLRSNNICATRDFKKFYTTNLMHVLDPTDTFLFSSFSVTPMRPTWDPVQRRFWSAYGGILVYSEDGIEWKSSKKKTNINNTQAIISPILSYGDVMAFGYGYNNYQYYYSTDGGATWNSRNLAYTAIANSQVISQWFRTRTGTILAAGGNRIFKSTNNCATFTAVHGFTGSGNNNNSKFFQLDNGDIGYIIYGGSSIVVAKSTDDGDTWTEHSHPFGLYCHAASGSRIYVAPNIALTTTQAVYYSDDCGATWTTVTNTRLQNYATLTDSIEYVNGQFLMQGVRDGILFSSTDFLNWNQIYTIDSCPSSIDRVGYYPYLGYAAVKLTSGRILGMMQSTAIVTDDNFNTFSYGGVLSNLTGLNANVDRAYVLNNDTVTMFCRNRVVTCNNPEDPVPNITYGHILFDSATFPLNWNDPLIKVGDEAYFFQQQAYAAGTTGKYYKYNTTTLQWESFSAVPGDPTYSTQIRHYTHDGTNFWIIAIKNNQYMAFKTPDLVTWTTYDIGSITGMPVIGSGQQLHVYWMTDKFILINATGVYQSTDFLTWTTVTRQVTSVKTYKRGTSLFAPTFYRTYESTDGINWSVIEHPSCPDYPGPSSVNSLLITSNYIYGCSNTALWRYDRINKKSEFVSGFTNALNSSRTITRNAFKRTFLMTDIGYVYRSHDFGKTFIRDFDTGNSVCTIVADCEKYSYVSTGVVTAGTLNLWRRDNKTGAYTLVSPYGLNAIPPSSSSYQTIAKNDFVAMSSLTNAVIEYSTDAGMTWQSYTLTGTTGVGQCQFFCEQNGIIFAMFYSKYFGYSLDGGTTWQTYDASLRSSNPILDVYYYENKWYMVDSSQVWQCDTFDPVATNWITTDWNSIGYIQYASSDMIGSANTQNILSAMSYPNKVMYNGAMYMFNTNQIVKLAPGIYGPGYYCNFLAVSRQWGDTRSGALFNDTTNSLYTSSGSAGKTWFYEFSANKAKSTEYLTLPNVPEVNGLKTYMFAG